MFLENLDKSFNLPDFPECDKFTRIHGLANIVDSLIAHGENPGYTSGSKWRTGPLVLS